MKHLFVKRYFPFFQKSYDALFLWQKPENRDSIRCYVVKPDGTVTSFDVSTGPLTEAERQIIVDGCLINYYRNN